VRARLHVASVRRERDLFPGLLPTPDGDNGEDKVVSSNGSYNATATLTSSTTWGHADGYLQGEA